MLRSPEPLLALGEGGSVKSRPLYLQGGSSAPIFAILHHGEAPIREVAVLLCPPFGWEDVCSYRIRREWAEHLARAGYTTLRIDLPGSGDSASVWSDPGQLDAWTDAVDVAARWLRAGGAEQVAVIGLGLGGMVSCRAALRGAPIDELVLWSVPARGKRLVRELRTFSAFEVANIPDRERPAPGGELGDDGTLAANGYLLSAETVEALERFDLKEMDFSQLRTRRVLVLGRDGLKADKSLSGAFEQAGAAVTVAEGPGYGAMMVEPQDARAPSEVIELVSSWLEEGDQPRGDGEIWRGIPAEASVTAASTVGLRDAEDSATPSEHDEVVLHVAGVALRERPVSIDGPEGPLFGVLTEPLGPRKELTALLLNAGLQRRTGPNRMWVEIARRWAASGVPTLRLDAAGIGDSEGDASVLARVAEFYKPRFVEQTRAVLEALAEDGLPERFVVLGLCAGCYWAANAALADERVATVIMLNPRTLVFDEWRHTLRRTRHLRERMLLPSTWRKVFSGKIKFAKHLETGRALIGQAALAPRQTRKLLAASRSKRETESDPVARLFDALRDRDQRALLLFTGKEVLHRELSSNGVLDRLDQWPNIELALLGTSVNTHTLTPPWLQRQVHTLIDSVLDEELKRVP